MIVEDKVRRKYKKNDLPAATAAAILVLDGNLTHERAGEETGAGSELLVRVAVAREEGRREARKEIETELATALNGANFTDKSKLKIDDAVRIHKTRLNKQFDQRVNEEVRRRIDAANDATRANNKRLHLENINLMRIVGERGVFTETQYRQMLMLCHPDSSAGPELKAALLQVLVDNKIKLIKGERK
jgi:hypothetical protein